MTQIALARVRRLKAVGLALAAMMLLASCGGAGPVTEVSSGEDDQLVDEQMVDDGGDTADLPGQDDDETRDLIVVPEGQAAPSPAPDASPTERQRRQVQQLPGVDPITGEFERLPLPEEDLDDASHPANRPVAVAPQVQRGDLDEFPSTIQVGDGRTSAPDVPDDPAPPLSDSTRRSGDAPAPIPSYSEDDLVSGVVPPESDRFDEVETDPTPDVRGARDETVDPGLVVEPVEVPLPDVVDGVEVVDDCARRPWGRGCPVPEDLFGRGDDDGDNDELTDPIDVGDDGDVGGVGGVGVPQDVIDILLSPADNTALPD